MLLQSEKICYHVLERQYNREKAAAAVIAIIIKTIDRHSSVFGQVWMCGHFLLKILFISYF